MGGPGPIFAIDAVLLVTVAVVVMVVVLSGAVVAAGAKIMSTGRG